MESVDDDSQENESGSSDDDELELELVGQLKQKIKESPYQYDNHTELIKLLKKLGELEELRNARENMSKLFPLTPELWLDWIKDEMKCISSEAEDREKIHKLFNTAVQDYQSVPLWLEFAQFSIGEMSSKDGMRKTRETFERAITAVGLHVSQGSTIWEAYRELENAVLATLMPMPGSVATEEQEEAFSAQNQRVSLLFKRQLAIPLLDMGETLSEYKEWLCDEIDAATQASYNTAVKTLEKLKPFETALLTATAPRWEEYQSYIEHEIKEGDPSRIQCIYERAITENCLSPEIWLQYTKYLDSKLKIKSVILPVYERAVRNCTWSSQIWHGYVLALERHKETPDKIKSTVEKALSSGFTQASEYCTIWTCYCDYLRRQINWDTDHEQQLELFRETIEKALDNLYEYFGNSGDENGALKQYWALIEAKFCKNLSKAREIWNKIMTEGHGNEAASWLEYYKLERAYGDNMHCRKLLQKAVNSVTDWPESITQAYINFEREEGTLEDYDIAVSRCEAQLDRITDRKVKAAEKEELMGQQKKHGKGEKKNNKKFEKAKNKDNLKKTDTQFVNKNSKNNKTSPIKRKFEDNTETVSQQSSPASDGFRIPPPPGYKGEPPPPKKAKTEPPHVEQVIHDASKDNRTVFVSNLSFNVNEDSIKDIFCKCGEISEIRLVKNIRGKSKGYAYVEFVDELCVPKALILDRHPINGRPMYVSKCEDRGGGEKADFRYATSVEKNKLFIKDLPLTCTKQALATIFNQHGKLKDVRMITYRSGKPKGLAYVEYESEADASLAVMKTDGLQIGENTISVAISNPPERRTPITKRNEFIPSLGGGKKESETRGKARTQIALLPRSVRKAPPTAKGRPATSSASATSSAPSNGAGGGDAEPAAPISAMSNADFRNMLLKK
ncbi:hypothetical protein SNE40_005118 [Patella caerulea]